MAGIIKAAERSKPAGASALVPFHFDDVGQSYLEHALAEAARLGAEAGLKAPKFKAKPTEEGRQAEIQAAQASLRTQLDQRLASVLTALGQAAQNIDHARHTWHQHWEQHAVALAAAISARLC